MKKKPDLEMLSEYDFVKGARGKFAKKFAEGNNIVVLDADVHKIFPNSITVNETLRAIAKIANKGRKRTVA